MKFDDIVPLIETDRLAELGEALKSLSPELRKELAQDLIAYERKYRDRGSSVDLTETLAVAGAGLLPNASALTSWLVRHYIWYRPDNAMSVVCDVLRHRAPSWMPNLVSRLAAKMPRDLTRGDLLRVILEFCDEDPPDSDGFLLHFMDFGGFRKWRPGFDALVPRMFEVVGAGEIIGYTRQWRTFLRDRADRQVVLDGCLARLQQGGRAKEMEGFLDLYDVLQVSLDESAEHARDYVAMLPDSRSTVAAFAQTQLKRLDEAGRLDFDLLLDASRWVFGRTEKKLIRAQLTLLGKHAATNPDEVVQTVAELFTHESDDVRGQAVKLVAKHLTKISPELLAHAEQLPPDLAAQLGVEAATAETVELAPFTPRPFPAPIATLDELTREVLALFGRNTAPTGAVTAERIIEAVVRFAWQDREAVAKAFQPIYAKYPWILDESSYDFYADYAKRGPRTELIAIIAAASSPPRQSDGAWLKQLQRARYGSVAEQLAKRLREIATSLATSPRPALVSTPTEMSGLLDPATLRERLARAEAEGWEPWPLDLQQAYDRLPGESDPDVTIEERTFREPGYGTDIGLFAIVTPGLETPEKLLREYDIWGPMIEWWPSALPAQRELVAAHMIPHLRYATASKENDGPLLPMLAEADGRAGLAVHLALAYGLAAELTLNRAHAVDALLILAARDQLDGSTLGDLVGQLVERGDIALNRVVPCLRDAARSGAARQIWDALAAALPKLWTHNRVADVIELAVELAQQLKPGGQIDGLAEIAARKGSSKAVAQAKRLASALG